MPSFEDMAGLVDVDLTATESGGTQADESDSDAELEDAAKQIKTIDHEDIANEKETEQNSAPGFSASVLNMYAHVEHTGTEPRCAFSHRY